MSDRIPEIMNAVHSTVAQGTIVASQIARQHAERQAYRAALTAAGTVVMSPSPPLTLAAGTPIEVNDDLHVESEVRLTLSARIPVEANVAEQDEAVAAGCLDAAAGLAQRRCVLHPEVDP